MSKTLNKEIIDNSIKEYYQKNNLINNNPITFQEIIEKTLVIILIGFLMIFWKENHLRISELRKLMSQIN